MTFLQLKQRLARRLNRASGTIVSATNTRFNDVLNERHKEILRAPGFLSLRWVPITFASVASQQAYALPMQGIARLNLVYDTTNRITLAYRDLDWLRTIDPSPATGTASFWIPTGMVQVHTQPSDASEVFVKSTASGDTSQIAYVEGIITGGYRRTASVTLTGTTAVSLATAITNWLRIDKCYLSAVGAGIVTLHEDSGTGTELSRIAIGDTYGSFLSFLLYLTPSAVVTYSVDATRTIPDMSNDTDEPWIPEDFHDLLIDGAELSEVTKSDDAARYRLVERRWTDGLRDLRMWVQHHPDWHPVVAGGRTIVAPEQRWVIADA